MKEVRRNEPLEARCLKRCSAQIPPECLIRENNLPIGVKSGGCADEHGFGGRVYKPFRCGAPINMD